jgi:hypothetical protein
VENCLRGVALGRKNWSFAGSDAGGERAAAIYTIIETAKLNGTDPTSFAMTSRAVYRRGLLRSRSGCFSQPLR